FGNRHGDAEIAQARDAVSADSARHNARIVGEIWRDVERDAVIGHPARDADADGSDLVFAAPADAPNTDASVSALALPTELGKGVDDPAFEIADEAAHVASAAFQVEHHVGDPLAGAVIGELAPTARLEDRETGFEEVLGLSTRAGGIKRR